MIFQVAFHMFQGHFPTRIYFLYAPKILKSPGLPHEGEGCLTGKTKIPRKARPASLNPWPINRPKNDPGKLVVGLSWPRKLIATNFGRLRRCAFTMVCSKHNLLNGCLLNVYELQYKMFFVYTKALPKDQ